MQQYTGSYLVVSRTIPVEKNEVYWVCATHGEKERGTMPKCPICERRLVRRKRTVWATPTLDDLLAKAPESIVAGDMRQLNIQSTDELYLVGNVGGASTEVPKGKFHLANDEEMILSCLHNMQTMYADIVSYMEKVAKAEVMYGTLVWHEEQA